MIRCCLFFFQAEDGIRDLVRSRGLGDVYKRQEQGDDVRVMVMPGEDRSPLAGMDVEFVEGNLLDLSLIHI